MWRVVGGYLEKDYVRVAQILSDQHEVELRELCVELNNIVDLPEDYE